MPKDRKTNETNIKRQKDLVSEINEYLTPGTYKTLYLEVALQDRVIQNIRFAAIDKKDVKKV